jgi:hypothetical protein
MFKINADLKTLFGKGDVKESAESTKGIESVEGVEGVESMESKKRMESMESKKRMESMESKKRMESMESIESIEMVDKPFFINSVQDSVWTYNEQDWKDNREFLTKEYKDKHKQAKKHKRRH